MFFLEYIMNSMIPDDLADPDTLVWQQTCWAPHLDFAMTSLWDVKGGTSSCFFAFPMSNIQVGAKLSPTEFRQVPDIPINLIDF